MKAFFVLAASTVLVAGCVSDPAKVDPDVFRDKATQRVTREVALRDEIAAGNLFKGTVKCWESDDIRVKQFRDDKGYTITVGAYGGGQRSLLFMADIRKTGEQTAQITVSHQYPAHKKFAENIAAWADNSAIECVSLVSESARR